MTEEKRFCKMDDNNKKIACEHAKDKKQAEKKLRKFKGKLYEMSEC